MKWFYDLSIRIKLMSCFMIVAAITGGLGFKSMTEIEDLNKLSDSVYHDDLMSINHLSTANDSFLNSDIELHEMLVSEDNSEREQLSNAISENTKKTNEMINEFSRANLTSEETTNLNIFRTSFSKYTELRDRAIALLLKREDARAKEIIDGSAEEPQKTSHSILKGLISIEVEVASKNNTERENITSSSLSSIKTIIIFAVLFSVMIGLWLSSIISKPLRVMVSAAQKLSRGDVNVELPIETEDELGVLTGAFKDMAKSAKEQANIAKHIASGDLSIEVKARSENDILSHAFIAVTNTLRSLVADTQMLSTATTEGKLMTRADGTKHQGEFRKIVDGVNSSVSSLVGFMDEMPLPVMIRAAQDRTILYINQFAAKIGNTTSKQLAGTKCNDYFRTSDCDNGKCACERAVRNGGQANGETVAKVAGLNLEINYTGTPIRNASGEIVGILEVVLDQTAIKQAQRITDKIGAYQKNEVEKLTAALGSLAKGDLSFTVKPADGDEHTHETRQNFVKIADALMQSASTIKDLTSEVGILSKAAIDGKLGVRGRADRFQGEYKEIINGVNGTLDSVVGPLNVAAEYVSRISKGDIPHKITNQYNGDFNEIKDNLNTCIDTVNALITDVQTLSTATTEGHLMTRADVTKHQGGYRKIIEGVNSTVASLVGFLDEIPLPLMVRSMDRSILYINTFAAKIGNTTAKQLAGTKCNEYFKTLDCDNGQCACERACREGRQAKGETVAKVAGLNLDIDYLGTPIRNAAGTIVGALEVVVDQTAIKKAQRVANKVNEYQKNEVTKLTAALGSLAKGDLNFTVKPADGDADTAETHKNFVQIGEAVMQSVAAVKHLTEDTLMLSRAAVEGKLTTRADAKRHQGDYRNIVEGVNSTLDAVIKPITEAGDVIAKVAKQDLTVLVRGEYAGDLAIMKDNINAMVTDLRSNMKKIGEAASSLGSASEELTHVSTQMAANSEEASAQANVVSATSEQVSKNVTVVSGASEEMLASIREIAKNAGEAAKTARGAVDAAYETNRTVSKLGESSTEIGNVVKMITAIAQQTNLLALNATIEAARAGEAGKGFAVVANEVKELAKETAKATEDISRKIDVIQTDTKSAVGAIGQIGTVIQNINDISNVIAAAVEEQSVTTGEMNRNLNEAAIGTNDIASNISGVAQATQETTLGASQIQDSARSVNDMATSLQHLVLQFRM